MSVAVAFPAAVALAGCAPPQRAQAAQSAEVTRTLGWDGGDRLYVGGASEVRYVPGAANTVTITGPQDEVQRMVVRHGAIYQEPLSSWWGQLFGFSWRDHDRIRIVVTTPRLSQVGVSGASSLDLGRLAQDRLELHLSGASHATAAGAIGKLSVSASGASGVNLDALKSDEIDAGLSGASWVKASGEARSVLLQASGASHADFTGLGLDEADAQLSGAGGAVLAPRRQAEVGVSGGAHVQLLTRPAVLQVHRSGGGSVVGPDGPEGQDWRDRRWD